MSTLITSANIRTVISVLITTTDAKSIATAVVSSRLDYCNALLYGTSAANINKLQRVQNSLARLVVGGGRWTHAPSILTDLHWLPVSTRINYIILLLSYKALTSQRPSYLHELLQIGRPVRQLRSNDHVKLHDSGARTVFGSRAIRHATSTLWNLLPPAITTV
jgi:hypothetical protein